MENTGMDIATDKIANFTTLKTHTHETFCVYRALTQLSTKQRDCILLQQEFSLEVIADLLEIPINEVKKHVKEGRKRFLQSYRFQTKISNGSTLETGDLEMLFLDPCDDWIEKLIAVHPNDLTSFERDAFYRHMDSCPTCNETHMAYLIMDIKIRRTSNVIFNSYLPLSDTQLSQNDDALNIQRRPITEDLVDDVNTCIH